GHGGTGTYGSRDDWAGVDVHGKIVLVLDGPSDGGRVTRLEKLIAAKWRGAAALLLVGDTLPSLDATAAGVGLVSATISRETAATFAPGMRARLRAARPVRSSSRSSAAKSSASSAPATTYASPPSPSPSRSRCSTSTWSVASATTG